jgi:exodeoxyribonuclease VII large subunit
VPLRLGLITSLESAAYHDFLKELGLAGIAFRLDCVDARVQGPDQEADMRAAFRHFARRAADYDALVLIRGGGSRSDLMGFDSEPLARAIAASPLPVLTGIGHEIDRSIADEVAHRAFKTPTAVAQYLVQRVERFLEALEERAREIRREGERQLALAQRRLDADAHLLRAAVGVRLRAKREQLGALGARLPHAARQGPRFARRHLRHLESALAPERIRRVPRRAARRLGESLRGLHLIAGRILLRGELDLAARRARLGQSSHQRLASAARALDRCDGRLRPLPRQRLAAAARELDHRGARLRLLDPVNVLRRGFTLTRDAGGRLLLSAKQAKLGEALLTQFHDGELISEAKSIRPAAADKASKRSQTTAADKPGKGGRPSRGGTRNSKEDP